MQVDLFVDFVFIYVYLYLYCKYIIDGLRFWVDDILFIRFKFSVDVYY